MNASAAVSTARRPNRTSMSPQTQLEEVVKDIQPMLPRVGKTFITDHSILERLQKIFPDKEIKRVQACKGSERTLPPPRDLVKNEAPYRRAMIVSRTGAKTCLIVSKSAQHILLD